MTQNAWTQYDTRADQLMLRGDERAAYLALNRHADAMGTCPSCGATVSRYESERVTHARSCRYLLADVATPVDLPLLAVRQAEWGHWGITFSWGVPGAYAPARIEGTLPFPCGPQGPQDGHLGSPERERYAAMVKAWRDQGTLPEGLHPAAAQLVTWRRNL